jgi:L-lactate utilization protein LutB
MGLPSVFVFEPSCEKRKRSFASAFIRKERLKGPQEFREELRALRMKVRSNLDRLLGMFLSEVHSLSGVNICMADRAEDAAQYIKERMGDLKHVSLNRSSVVVNELRPFLRAFGFRTFLRYFGEFKNLDSSKLVLSDYWALPDLHRRNLLESFEAEKIAGLEGSHGLRGYGAILGVNAACARDGSLFFLQHMSNISKDLLQASKLFFIVPLEKIVEDAQEASVHVKGMGIFGLEPLLLDLRPKEEEIFHFDGLPAFHGDREVHVIVLDNGRRRLLGTAFSDLLLCIDCRACTRQCPVGAHLSLPEDLIYSPKNLLLLYLQGRSRPFELCLHCGRCEVECPCGIDIPRLLWQAQLDFYKRKRRGLRRMLLDDPELLAKAGNLFFPFSNAILKMRVARVIVELLAGIHRDAALPSFRAETLRGLMRRTRG